MFENPGGKGTAHLPPAADAHEVWWFFGKSLSKNKNFESPLKKNISDKNFKLPMHNHLW